MRVVRVLLGLFAVLIALPLLCGGGALVELGRHRAPDGSFSAALEQVDTGGYAVVVPDLDELLRRDLPFVRGADTTLRISARTGGRPAFVGLATRAAVERYLAGVPYASVNRVRLARGSLPVSVVQVAGAGRPATGPAIQPFWVSASASGTLEWTPASVRARRLALVVMNEDGAPSVQLRLAASVTPGWLAATSWGFLALGAVAFAVGLVLLFWPGRRREIVYVVERGQLAELSARLGLREPGLPEPGLLEPGLLAPGRPEPGASEAEPEPREPDDPIGLFPLPAGYALPAGAMPAEAAPLDNRVAPGTYRSVAVPPPITPSFVWPPVSQGSHPGR